MSVYSIKLLGEALIDAMVRDISLSGQTPVAAAERSLEAYLFTSFQEALGAIILKPPVVRLHSTYFKERYATLPSLSTGGYKTWYTEVAFVTKPNTLVEQIDFETLGMGLHSIDYGQGVHVTTQLKSKPMKTQVRHELRINTLTIDKGVFAEVLKRIQSTGALEQPLIANFSCGPEIEAYRVVSFDHMLTGQRYFCDCAKGLHKQLLEEAVQIKGGYTGHGWPHQMESLLGNPEYLEGICHMCVARASSSQEARLRYGSSIETSFGNYVDQIIVDESTDRKTARAEVQELLGLSRWVREATLYRTVKELFPNHRVLREASPELLGRLRLDIYLPDLKLAIEHQGEQHYRSLGVFGGEEAHVRTLKRDQVKRDRCAESGIDLIEIRYDSPISKAALRQRLQKFIEKAEVAIALK